MKKTIIISILFLLIINSYSQQSTTMYFMKHNPQSTLLNPAMQGDCNVYIGGLLMAPTPVLGQVFAPVYFNYSNTTFDYNTIIHQGEGLYKDSLVIDLANFINKLHPVNYMMIQANIDILSVGAKYKDYYFTLNITEKIDTKFDFSRDLFQSIYYGNGHPANIGRTMNLSAGLNATHYREWAFGLSKKVNDKLFVGGRAKVLFGMLNINTKRSDNTWLTDNTYFSYRLSTDTKVNISSIPIYVEYNDTTGEVDSIAFKDVENDYVKEYLLNFKNKGFGLDLGATYQFNDRILLAASLLDLGFIRWKKDVYSFEDKGNFFFRGVDMSNMANKEDTTNAFENLADSLQANFKITGENKPYTTFLTPKLYLGGTFKLNEMIDFGAVLRIEFLQKLIHPSLTFSANINPIKWFSVSGSYTMLNNRYYYFGLGFSTKLGPFKLFLVNDNITGLIWPQTTRNIDWRTGLFLNLGCKLKEKKEKKDKALF